MRCVGPQSRRADPPGQRSEDRPCGRSRRRETVTAPGAVELLIKARGKKKRKLNETGKVKPNVTFTPTGGDPSTQSRKLKLKKS